YRQLTLIIDPERGVIAISDQLVPFNVAADFPNARLTLLYFCDDFLSNRDIPFTISRMSRMNEQLLELVERQMREVFNVAYHRGRYSPGWSRYLTDRPTNTLNPLTGFQANLRQASMEEISRLAGRTRLLHQIRQA